MVSSKLLVLTAVLIVASITVGMFVIINSGDTPTAQQESGNDAKRNFVVNVTDSVPIDEMNN